MILNHLWKKKPFKQIIFSQGYFVFDYFVSIYHSLFLPSSVILPWNEIKLSAILSDVFVSPLYLRIILLLSRFSFFFLSSFLYHYYYHYYYYYYYYYNTVILGFYPYLVSRTVTIIYNFAVLPAAITT
jgi:hypothetical protein